MSLEQVALQQQDLNLGHDLNERIKVINFTSSGGMPQDFIVMYQLPESSWRQWKRNGWEFTNSYIGGGEKCEG